ncbi:hypothetical protein O6H91_01G019700 [Diphasiastrum complanatum]|uniref:Uncharacterized protein n=1 Tax=Diphasiastrum complanatum TaxID=34168 RepID=A0ACC2ENW4_DIPCM|nr:hypothetical protein O6H91_01G019700 [Diphasiastrum complanatum]
MERMIYLSGIPLTAVAKELVDFLEGVLGDGSVQAVDIKTKGRNGMSQGYGFVEFVEAEVASKALLLGKQGLFLRVVRASPTHKPGKLEKGHLSMGCQMSKDTCHVLWSTANVATELDHSAKTISFFFGQQNIEYKMVQQYKSMYEINTCTPVGSTSNALLLQLIYPPQVYLRREGSRGSIEFDKILPSHLLSYCKDDQEPPWIRTTDFTPNRSIGQSLVYYKVVKELADFSLTFHPTIFEKINLRCGDSFSSSQELVPLLSSDHVNRLPFEIVFKLNNIVQQGLLNGPDITPEFCDLLDPSKTPLEHARLTLEDFGKSRVTVYNPMRFLRRKLQHYKRSPRSPKDGVIKPDHGQMLVNRLLITPTKVYCMGPEIDVSNRVTRHFASVIDNFLRVAFVEEDWSRIPSTTLSVPLTGGARTVRKTDTSDVYSRILRVLQNGVYLGGKHYEFLAFSASQLREQSVWMFASTTTVTANSIRSWMGDFLSIRNVAKCAARMGQSFSSSTHTLNVSSYEISHIPDVERVSGQIKYCFSDGIGKISKAFAMEVGAKCGLSKVPSAFQIRYGGYKGVVAIDLSCFYKLSLRPSMCKFPSPHTGLDVLSWTRFIPCYLNRQVVNLLSTLGRDVVEQLDRILHDPVVALEVLQIAYAGHSHKTMVQMFHAGYHPQTEPYLNSSLQVFRASQCLMGCLDETGILEYGEAFVQVSPTSGTRLLLKDGLKAPQGRCGDSGQESACVVHVVVAKNPCLHPGDVRVLRAVDVPRLRHMVDCIVFPQRGPRPHPDECSGSDLDGDLYFVSWDEGLIPPSTDPPMNYNRHGLNWQEIEEFFLNHMMNDSLGLIANAHMVHADGKSDKARDPNCIKLAELFSIAVDFPKTGVPALIPVNLRPKTYPDFMEDNKPFYISSSILGKLFQSVKEAATVELPMVLFSEEDVYKAYDKHLEVDGFQQYVDEAMTYKSWYDAKLTGLMNQYGIKQEAEVLSGNILRLSRYYCQCQRDVKERIQHAVNALQKEARSWFEVGGEQDIHYAVQESSAKASAWYQVTYNPYYRKFYQEDLEEDDYSSYSNLLSFPWVVYDKLLAIKLASMNS